MQSRQAQRAIAVRSVCSQPLAGRVAAETYIFAAIHACRALQRRRAAATMMESTPAVSLLRRLGDAHFLDASQRPFPAQPLAGRSTNVLINGCGRSGTHAITSLLKRNGVLAQHEGRGKDNITVGWPYIGRFHNWKLIWPMRFQPQADDAHDPIFKVHRHPLSTVNSIANGFTTSGKCRMNNPSETRWESRAWNCASKFVPLPITPTAIAEQTTCAFNRRQRLRLALHYWVKWNLLGDRWATHTFQIENVTVADITHRWCEHCARLGTCKCPQAAQNTANAGPGAGTEKVRARRGHGRKKASLTWDTLIAIDSDMARVAILMAQQYGYNLTL